MLPWNQNSITKLEDESFSNALKIEPFYFINLPITINMRLSGTSSISRAGDEAIMNFVHYTQVLYSLHNTSIVYQHLQQILKLNYILSIDFLCKLLFTQCTTYKKDVVCLNVGE